MEVILFLIFAAIAVAGAVNLVLQSHPISSALSLVAVMGAIAALYLLLGGEFLAAVQLIVYAGAIMVLFLFVIMLLNAGREHRPARRMVRAAVAVPLLTTMLGLAAWLILSLVPGGEVVRLGAYTVGPKAIGKALFTTYLLPFEVTSILILIAILGAIVLARKEI
jgi:NADH-quinone oxidoreductase subunit J